MKKSIIYFSLAVMVISLNYSCKKDFLDSKHDGLPVPGTDYPITVQNFESLTTALYGLVSAEYIESGDFVACDAGDDVTTSPGGGKIGYLEFDIFSAHDNNALIWKAWDTRYAVIKQSNDIINSINLQLADPNYTEEALQHFKNRTLGQAYFLRALAYFDLVRTFGQVPLITKVEVNYTEPKAEFKDIYDTIISDLKNAETLLPPVYGAVSDLTSVEKNTAYARPSSGSAKSLMASVYLTMAGYPLKDPSNYALAAAKAKEVIDNEAAYGYQLMPENQLWSWQYNSAAISNAEGVFTTFFNRYSPATGYNGNEITSSQSPSEMGGWNDYFAELNFYNEFPAGIRKDVTFISAVVSNNGKVITPWQNFTTKHPHYAKYAWAEGLDSLNMDKGFGDWWSDRTVPVIRYAEVLLVYAEAQAMADGSPNALAYKSLNRVRERAGEEDMKTGLSGTIFRDSVINERKWEFAGIEPNARWFDEVRTETVASSTAKRSPNDVPLVGKPDDVTHTFYFAPIPASEKQLNPNLQ